MTDLLPFLITGVVTGSLFGVAGLGLVLTYRTSGVFNFGHGAIAAGAAFLFYSLHVEHHLPWPLAGSITLVIFGVVGGWLMDRVTRGLGEVPEAVIVMVTVGVLLAIQGYLSIQYGPVTRNFPDFLPVSGFTVLGVNVTWSQVISVALAGACTAGLGLFLHRSRLGIAMRAVVDNPVLVALSGDNTPRIRRTAWAIGSSFAALSGMLLAPTLGLDAILLTMLVVQAFGACALGFFSSLPLTYLGGIVVGVVASVATKHFTMPPLNGVPPTVPFLVLVVVLLLIPVAKLPQRRVRARYFASGGEGLSARWLSASLVLVLGALLVVPVVVGTRLPVWIAGLTAVIIFGSLALLVWVSGQTSLCHAAFLAVGATTMARLAGDHGLPWGVALLLAGVVTIPVGALVAIPAIRLSGLYLALATLGFGILVQQMFYPTELMFGSALAVSAPRPRFGLFDANNDQHFYYLVLSLTALSVILLVVISRTRLGRLLRALAETPTMLSTHGLGVNTTRLIVFCVSAFFAGIAGGLQVTQFGAASGVAYGPLQSLLYLAVLAICGTRLLRSAILAAGLLAILPGYVTGFDTDRQALLFGLAAIAAGLAIAKRPQVSAWLAAAAGSSRERLAHSPARRLGITRAVR